MKAKLEEEKPPEVPLVFHANPGLTANELPAGWPEREASDRHLKRSSNPETPSSLAPKLTPPASSTGIARAWRFGRTFANLLLRPNIVKELPVHLQLESTDACNLNCTTCSRDVFVKKASMLKTDYWKRIVDEVRPTNINVSGIGEPFLHPEIFDIVRYAKSQGAAVNCATNFTRVKSRHREIVECGFGQLKVSIDATDAATYRAIRGEDSFDAIIDNIRQVVRIRDELNSDSPSIRFNFALQHLNFTQAPDLVELAAELGVDGIYFQYLEYVDMEDRKEMLTADMTEESLRSVLREAERRAADLGVITNLDIWWRDFDVFWNKMQPIEEFKPNSKQCYFPWFTAWLGADGWVRPCPIMPWTLDEGRMGHLGENTFSEIWNNEKYRALRQALARGERPTRSCKTCIPQSLHNILFLKTKLLPKK